MTLPPSFTASRTAGDDATAQELAFAYEQRICASLIGRTATIISLGPWSGMRAETISVPPHGPILRDAAAPLPDPPAAPPALCPTHSAYNHPDGDEPMAPVEGRRDPLIEALVADRVDPSWLGRPCVVLRAFTRLGTEGSDRWLLVQLLDRAGEADGDPEPVLGSMLRLDPPPDRRRPFSPV